jgi:hypothetical protein
MQYGELHFETSTPVTPGETCVLFAQPERAHFYGTELIVDDGLTDFFEVLDLRAMDDVPVTLVVKNISSKPLPFKATLRGEIR